MPSPISVVKRGLVVSNPYFSLRLTTECADCVETLAAERAGGGAGPVGGRRRPPRHEGGAEGGLGLRGDGLFEGRPEELLGLRPAHPAGGLARPGGV